MNFNNLLDEMNKGNLVIIDDNGNEIPLTDNLLKMKRVYSLEKEESFNETVDEFEHTVLRALEYLIRGETLHFAINIQTVFKDMDGEAVFNHMLENEFITDKLSPESFRAISDKFTIPMLNEILKEHNLKTSGNKQAHVDRVIENIDLNDIDVERYLGYEYNYIISEKGLNYYRENEYKLIYYNALDSYDFGEYEKYCQNNKDKNVLEVALGFLDKHEENAIDNKKNHYYKMVLESKERLISLYKLPVEKAFENNIKIFAYHLNSEKRLSSKLYSRNISDLRKNYKAIREGYAECLQRIYDETTYSKQFTYKETLTLLEEVFKGSTMKEIEKIMKGMMKNPSKKDEMKVD